MNSKRITVFVHIYYEDTFWSVYNQLKHLIKLETSYLFVNINNDNPQFDRIKKIIEVRYPHIILTKASNKGKDIGGKFAMLSLYLRLGIKSEYLLFLHDKKSPQLINGGYWQNKLFDIASEKKLVKVFRMFGDERVGMVGNKSNIMSKVNETDERLFVNNKAFIFDEAKKYSLSSQDYRFVGGTMFWVRESVFRDFFCKYDPLEIRKSFESGNVMDDFGPTVTHAWERLLGWIMSTKGYIIKGV